MLGAARHWHNPSARVCAFRVVGLHVVVPDQRLARKLRMFVSGAWLGWLV